MEKVLVVPSGVINSLSFLEGAVSDFRYAEILMQVVSLCGEFMEKDLAEINFEYRQVIPYIIIGEDGETFVYRRSTDGDEGRLWGKYSVGVGGHINEDDFKEDADTIRESISSAAFRELREEVDLDRDIKLEDLDFCGVINDNSNDVGKVHIGLLVKLKARVNKSSESALDSFAMTKNSEIKLNIGNFEDWSKLVIPYI